MQTISQLNVEVSFHASQYIIDAKYYDIFMADLEDKSSLAIHEFIKHQTTTMEKSNQ